MSAQGSGAKRTTFPPYLLEVSGEGCNFVGEKKIRKRNDMAEIKLPKCLTEKEANTIRDYNDLILSKLPEEERTRKIPRFLASVDCPQRGPRYSPFKSIDDVETNTECFNKKLYLGLLDAYEANTYDNSLPTPEVVLMLFNGAYAMSIHALNHKNPELYYEEDYRNIWWTGKVDADFGNEIDVHMEHICACMIYRILEAENNPRYDVLLRKIKNVIQNSYFVQADTLDLFKHTEVSVTPPTPPSSTTSTPEHSNDTPQAYSYTEKEQEAIAKVLKQDVNEYIIEKLKNCINNCETDADYALLEIVLYENNYIKERESHKAFIDAMIALHILEEGSVKIDNVRKKYSSLGKSYATTGTYKEWDKNNINRIKCEKFAEILKA